MKILVDIGHPAHVHFYKIPIKNWLSAGYQVVITSRVKEMATQLLDSLGAEHHVLSEENDGSKKGMIKELISRDYKLLKLVLKEKPDVMTGIGGIYVAHSGFVTRIPSVTFYDTENAKLSNLITYPFTSLVAVPECYNGWLPPWHKKYSGYHELSYLHENVFKADYSIALDCGLDPQKPTYLIRVVAWNANHDLNENGWSLKLLRQVIDELKLSGKVILSSEGDLPEDLIEYRYSGDSDKIHHLMNYCRMYVGESATMASECAVLGVPAIYAAETGRGYTDELESRYGLVFNCKEINWEHLKDVVKKVLAVDHITYCKKRKKCFRIKFL